MEYKELNISNYVKVYGCIGEGQGECKRCALVRGFNRNWLCMLYKIDGYNGLYCSDCMRFIVKELEKKQDV